MTSKRKMDMAEIESELEALFQDPNEPGMDRLRDFLEAPLDEYDVFELARLAETFEQLGELLKGVVRNDAIGMFGGKYREETSKGVNLKWRQGNSDSVRVNTDKIREAFPQKEFPSFYKPNPISETVIITVKRRT